MTRWSHTPHGGHTVVYEDDNRTPAESRQPIWYLTPPGGPNIGVYYDREARQWDISIDTEDMPTTDAHNDDGIPYLEVAINSGTVFDNEPDRGWTIGTAVSQEALQQVLEAIEAILRTDEWSVGMLEDIANLVQESKVKHPNPPTYYHH